jgi:L-seryl-tRNA(Ser) seleniumtransferase
VIDDVGAGSLIDFSQFGFEPEPTLPESVREGADIITCSADKMIGGCQGGIILGRAHLIRKIRKNTFARMMRVGKLTMAALEATLSLFLDESLALREVPTLRMLQRPLPEIAAQAERIVRAVGPRAAGAEVTVVEGFSQMGSGSLPAQNLPTRVVAVRPKKMGVEKLALRLRRHAPPVFSRIHKGQLLIDPRTVLDGEEEIVIGALVAVLTEDN